MFKKQILLVAATGLVSSVLASSALALVPGAYIGGQLGWGSVNQNNTNTKNAAQNAITVPALTPLASYGTSSSNSNSGLAGRIFAGYQFNETWSAELGFTKFHNTTSKAAYTFASAPTTIGSSTASTTTKVSSVDLVGKATMPLQNGFSVYGKLGLAYMMGSQKINVSTANVVSPGIANNTSSNTSERKIYPVLGVGASYDITQNWVADVSYTRMQKVGTSKILNSTNFVGLGLSYYFG